MHECVYGMAMLAAASAPRDGYELLRSIPDTEPGFTLRNARTVAFTGSACPWFTGSSRMAERDPRLYVRITNVRRAFCTYTRTYVRIYARTSAYVSELCTRYVRTYAHRTYGMGPFSFSDPLRRCPLPATRTCARSHAPFSRQTHLKICSAAIRTYVCAAYLRT